MSKQNKQQIVDNFNDKVECKDILFDIKFMMRKYYVATYKMEGDLLKVTFTNGQSFIVKAEECA